MITLEQIRLLESKITRAIELIRILKEENGALRRGLESAQKRMKELETLVDGFKTDQREIESVIVRTLHNLDELEESTAAGKRGEHTGAGASGAFAPTAPTAGPSPSSAAPTAQAAPVAPAVRAEAAEPHPPRRTPHEASGATEVPEAKNPELVKGHEPPAAKEELDIF
jgi:chemotaxis protein histidine kinase CheA